MGAINIVQTKRSLKAENYIENIINTHIPLKIKEVDLNKENKKDLEIANATLNPEPEVIELYLAQMF